MADDSLEIIEPFDFHPCNNPKGIPCYDLETLAPDQKSELNRFKRNLVRENEQYLAKHPEIRACVALITRHVLRHRPRTGLAEFIARFFQRSKLDIENEIKSYIEEREPHAYEGDSAVIHRGSSTTSLLLSEEEQVAEEEEGVEEDLEAVPRQVLDDILQEAYARLGIRFDDAAAAVEEGEFLKPRKSGESVVKEVISEILKKTVPDE